MDDSQLIYTTPNHMAATLQTLASLGVDRVKVSLVWSLVAPNPNSRKRPRGFDATNPAAYPPGAWDRYDLLVRFAGEVGLKVYFILIGPAPQWALPKREPQNQGPPVGRIPSVREYRQFVEAAGRRYSGSYIAPTPNPPGDSVLGTVNVIPQLSDPNTPTPIPRVAYWGIWNEPNERSWNNPWHRQLRGGRRAMIQPANYRGLVDGGWNGLRFSGHGNDTILIGETANRGILEPIPFIRDLYCLSSRYRPLTGEAATEVGCPTSGDRSKFLSQHPGLFQASGYAHHPYAFDVPPNRAYPNRTFITMHNVHILERVMNRIFAAYDQHPRSGVPLYLTEWGYKTNPPNPYVHTTQAEQAVWLNEGEFMTWREPYVRALTQFLLVDSGPKAGAAAGSPQYWSTYQTGLLTMDWSPKPALYSFRIPIWVPVAHHGPSVTVWGQLRPANHSITQYGVIEYKRKGTSQWTELGEAQTNNAEGFLSTQVSVPAAGALRLGWLDPSGRVSYSRTVKIS